MRRIGDRMFDGSLVGFLWFLASVASAALVITGVMMLVIPW